MLYNKALDLNSLDLDLSDKRKLVFKVFSDFLCLRNIYKSDDLPRTDHLIFQLLERDLNLAAESLLIRDWNFFLLKQLLGVRSQFRDLSLGHRDVYAIGRDSQDPSIGNYGNLFGGYYDVVDEFIRRFHLRRDLVEVISIDTSTQFSPEAQDYLARNLDLFSIHSHLGLGFKFQEFCLPIKNFCNFMGDVVKHLWFLSSQFVGEVFIRNGDSFDALIHSMGEVNGFEFNILHGRINLLGFFQLFSGFLGHLVNFLDGLCVRLDRVSENLRAGEDEVFLLGIKQRIYLNQPSSDMGLIDRQLRALGPGGEPGTFRSNFLSSSICNFFFSRGEAMELFSHQYYARDLSRSYDRIHSRNLYGDKFLEIFHEGPELEMRIRKLADNVNFEYRDESDPVCLVGFTEGSLVFLGKLLPHLNFPLTVTTYNFSHYKESSGNSRNSEDRLYFNVKLFEDRRVLLVDDIIDYGSTLKNFIRKMNSEVSIRDYKVLTLFEKRNYDQREIRVDFPALELNRRSYVVGFGMDKGETYRNANWVGSV